MVLSAQDRFKAESLSVIELFQNSVYEIPRFQRDYAWTKEQYKDFWNDWKRTSESENAAHFLGPIVVVRQTDHPNKFLVIDGQQRITTLQLIISLIRDRWIELNVGMKKTKAGPRPYFETCQSMIVSGPPHYERTFIPNFYISELFWDYIQREITDTDRKHLVNIKTLPDSVRNHSVELVAAYQFFKSQIANLDVQDLENYERALLTSFVMLRIDAIEIENAFLLFDTLNNRGIDLTQGDLVKNHFFQRLHDSGSFSISNETQKYLNLWDSIVEKVTISKFDTFLRYFLILKTKNKVQKESISREIARLSPTRTKAKEIIGDLSDKANNFALIHGFQNFTGNHKDEIDVIFEDLRGLDQDTQSIALLAVLERFYPCSTKAKFESLSVLSRAIEILSFKFLIVGENAQDVENVWRDVANTVSNKSDSDEDVVKSAMSYMKDVMPQDNEFINEFQNRQIKVSKFARYILRKIENFRKSNPAWVLAGSSRLDVEHIAPKAPDADSDWRKKMSGELNYKSVIYLIGNQTLLSQGLNRRARNSEFRKKKDLYLLEEDNLPAITCDVIKEKSWTQDVVIKRSKNLAKEALLVWSWESLKLKVKVVGTKVSKNKRKAVVKKPTRTKKTTSTRSRKKSSKSTSTRKSARSNNSK